MSDNGGIRIVSSTQVQSGWPPVLRHTVEFPDGRRREWTALEFPDGVAVLALTEDGKLLLLRQYALGLDSPGLTLPGGVAEPGETMEDAARREFVEETGYAVDELEYAFPYVGLPSYARGTIHLFLGRGARKATEERAIEVAGVELLDVADAVRMARAGEMPVASTVMAVLALEPRLLRR